MFMLSSAGVYSPIKLYRTVLCNYIDTIFDIRCQTQTLALRVPCVHGYGHECQKTFFKLLDYCHSFSTLKITFSFRQATRTSEYYFRPCNFSGSVNFARQVGESILLLLSCQPTYIGKQCDVKDCIGVIT
jgi:hypothetical protein